MKVIGGRGFEIHNENSRDVVLVRDHGSDGDVQTGSVISDFEYTWIRFGANSPNPHELLLLGGQSVQVAGERIVESAERVEYSWVKENPGQGTYVRN
jgi:hypothetical protein